jgi:hypothetical protein
MSVFDGAKPGDVFIHPDGDKMVRLNKDGGWDYYRLAAVGGRPTMGAWTKLAPDSDLGEGVTVERSGNEVMLKFAEPVRNVRFGRYIRFAEDSEPWFDSVSYQLAPPAPQLPPLPTWLGVVRGNRTGNVSFVSAIEDDSLLNMTFSDGTCGEFAASEFTLIDYPGIACSDELRQAMGGGV